MNDQYASPPGGIPVPFFGVKANTLGAVAPFALRTGAAVVPVSCHRDEDDGPDGPDAGAALRLIRDSFASDVDDARLEAIAASLGSDGAACLWARPVIAEGRGERLSPAPGLPRIDAVLVNP